MGKTFIADKETLDKCYSILSSDTVYGFIEHNATLAPASRIEYTGANKDYTPLTVNKSTGEASYGSWGDFPWLKGNIPYMVKSDGTPDYRLDPMDYTKKEDGTVSDVSDQSYDGGAFSWAPRIYKQEYMAGNDRYVNFSMTEREGFEPIGFIDPDNHVLEGVWIPMSYGAIVNDKMRCIFGNQPCYSKTTAEQKTAIDAFGSRAKFFGGAIIQTLIDLMILFAKTTDLQEAYGNGNMNGYDASLTPTMGVKENAVVGGGQFYGTSDGKSLNKIFHSIVLGSYQQYMRDPYTICVNGKLKVSKNYAYSLTAEGYSDTGIDYASIGDTSRHYPHRYKTVPGFGSVPDEPPYNGSTSLGGCDGFAVNAGITAVALRFGGCYNGLIDGPRHLHLDVAAALAHWTFGAAILLLPPVGIAA